MCNSILSRAFPKTNVPKDPFFNGVALEMVKKIQVESAQFIDDHSNPRMQDALIRYA